MKYLHLILRNLARKKLRTAFTLLSIFVSFLLFGLVVAVRTGFSQGVDVAGLDRLVTIHKVSLIQFLPIKYVNFVETVEGVKAVTHWTWFGGYYQEQRNQFAMFATDPESFLEVFDEYQVPEEQKRAWVQNRTGLLVGSSIAERFGWEVGDQVPILTNIWFQGDGSPTWDFTIEAIYELAEGGDTSQIYMNYDYLKEGATFEAFVQQMGGTGSDELGMISMVYMSIEDPESSAAIAERIDAHFANSPAETKTSTEKAFAQSFANQVGDLGSIVVGIVSVVFFTLLLVAGNTMAQSVRERTAELAVLKTVGFTDRTVMGLVLAESFILALVGGLPGLALANSISSGLNLELGFLPEFYVPTRQLVLGVALVLLLGLVTGVPPAWQALRLRIVNALQRR